MRCTDMHTCEKSKRPNEWMIYFLHVCTCTCTCMARAAVNATSAALAEALSAAQAANTTAALSHALSQAVTQGGNATAAALGGALVSSVASGNTSAAAEVLADAAGQGPEGIQAVARAVAAAYVAGPGEAELLGEAAAQAYNTVSLQTTAARSHQAAYERCCIMIIAMYAWRGAHHRHDGDHLGTVIACEGSARCQIDRTGMPDQT